MIAAITELDLIRWRAPTAEHYNLLGSAWKRLAWISDNEEECREALRHMREFYGQAMEIAPDNDKVYAFSHDSAAKMLAAQHDPEVGEWESELLSQCASMAETEKLVDKKKPDIWSGFQIADCEQLKWMINPPGGKAAATKEIEKIVQRYRTGLRRGGSPRERSSILEHLEFLIELNRNRKLKKGLRKIREALV